MVDFNTGGTDLFNEFVGPTDYKFSAKIIYADGHEGLELKPVITEMTYYEDLFGNACSGSLLMSDSSNYQHEMALCGDEFLKMMLLSHGKSDDQALKKYFRIYNTNKRNLSKDMNENYVLNFSTEELFLSEQYRVCKAYNAKISDIVIDIAKNYLNIQDSELEGNVIPTDQAFHFIVPNLKPMEAINWLCTHAVAEDSRLRGSTYLFYQDRKGWNFKPLLGIYGDFQKYGVMYNSDTNPYEYRTKNTESEDIAAVGNSDQDKNILSYQIMNNYDVMEATQDGVFANKLIWSNNLNRTHGIKKFDYDEYFKDLKDTLPLYKEKQPYGLMSDAEDRFKKKHNEVPDTVVKMGFKTENNQITKTIPHRYVQLRLASATRLKIAIPGDTELTVGVTVYIDLKAPAPVEAANASPKKKLDKFYSGWYLVTALVHRIDQDFGFETVLELCKDSFLSSVSEMDKPGLKPFDNGNPAILEARKKGVF